MTPPEPFHPELRRARWMPRASIGPRTTRLLRLPIPGSRRTRGVRVETVTAAGPAGDLKLRVFRPEDAAGPRPALLWMHGGGLLIGAPEQDDEHNLELVRRLGIVVVAPRYRLAPEHPGPAAIDDVTAAFRAMVDGAARLGVDPERIAIGGASAGGLLTAALAQRLRDEGGAQPVFQLLVYPMLDDRTVLRTDIDERHVRLWTAKSNRYAWRAHLGEAAFGERVDPYLVPARCADLSGLPPAWIGVGSLDLFRDEDAAYRDALRAAGVPCDWLEVPGAFHAFDALFRRAGVSREFLGAQAEALRGGLLGGETER